MKPAPAAVGRGTVLGLAAALVTAAPAVVRAGQYTPPRLAGSTVPDLRGIWQAHDTAYLNIEGHPAAGGIAAAPGIVDTPDHRIPYRPDAVAQRERNAAAHLAADPSLKCYEAGIPRATYLPTPFQIVQSGGPNGVTAFVYQDNHAFRIVYPASMPHSDGIDWWMGDSRGTWDGDTLVVDGATYNDQTWFDAAGHTHSSFLHVIERYRRTGPDTISYSARIEDAKVFTQPWTLHETLYRDGRPGARIAEDECLDDRDGVRHHISPSDPRSLQRSHYTRWDIARRLGFLVSGADVSTPPGKVAGSGAGSPPTWPTATGAVPRTGGGHPDFNGIWRSVSDVPVGPQSGPPPAAFFAKPGDDSSRDFDFAGVPRLPYTMAGFQEQMWRSRHQFLDGEPRCHLAGVPRAVAMPPYPAQLIQDDRSMTILYEYVHELRVIPIDGMPHPTSYAAWDGDSHAHWHGDTLVVDVADFNGRAWLNMTGNFVDDGEHAEERYTFLDADTVAYQVTVTDPGVFTQPWTLKLTMRRQPAGEHILEYACLEGESDRQHYTEQFGGKRAAVAGAGKPGTPAPAKTDPPVAVQTATGCLRGTLSGRSVAYSLQGSRGGGQTAGKSLRVVADQDVSTGLVELIDREVLLSGLAKDGGFQAERAEVLSEGCNATYD